MLKTPSKNKAGNSWSNNSDFDQVILDLEKWKVPALPPMKTRAKRLVVLVENKLIGIDSILPVAMELKHETPDMEVEFLFIRKGFMSAVKQNYVLWEGMKRTGRISVLIDADYRPAGVVGRLKSGFNLLIQVLKSLARPTLIFYRRDFAPFPLWLLAYAARRGGGALFGFPSFSHPMADVFIKHFFTRDPSTRGKREHHLLQNDRRLIFHPLQEKMEQRYSNAPMVAIGTPRQFPQWRKFLDSIESEQGIRDQEGRRIDTTQTKYVVMFYAGNLDLPMLEGPTACRDQFIKCLKAIRCIDPNLCVLIKPHPNCELTELGNELREFSDLKVRIVSAHPQILARHAVACFFSSGSSVHNDMYLEQVPVIDACLYSEEIATTSGSVYPNPGRVSCTSRDSIARALKDILENEGVFPRSETGHLYWQKIPRLSSVFWSDT